MADRSPLSGWPAMHRAARQSGLGLVYGVEVDIVLPPINSPKTKAPIEPAAQGTLLLARSPEGARNLAHMASSAYAHWPSHETPIPWDALAAHHDGLFLILPGGDEAGAPQPIAGQDARKAEAWAAALKSAFGNSLYIGLPHSGRPGDTALAEAIASRAQSLDLPLVALPPARYLLSGDAPAYEALKVARFRAGWPREIANLPASTGSIASDRAGYDYLRSPDEALALYSRWPAAIESAAHISTEVARIDTWPFETPDTNHARASLLEIVEQRLSQLPEFVAPTELLTRIESELDRSSRWGVAGAWSALAALATHAQDAREPVPTGSPVGHAINSSLAYTLGVSTTTPADPPTSVQIESPPFPGVTLPSAGRSLLLNRLAEEYGPDRVAYAACALDIMPVQALAASAAVLAVDSNTVRSIILAAIDGGWQALANATGSDPIIPTLADLAIALKGAPISSVPDRDTALVSPRAIYAGSTLASWLPLLQPPVGASSPLPSWSPWSAESLASLGYPAIHLPTSQQLDALHAALRLALRYPVPGLALPPADAGPDALSAALHSQHPSAYFAGALDTAWRHGEAVSVAPLAAEAHKLGIKIEPPHVNFSLEHHTLQRDGNSWSILWGLAALPGWSPAATQSFIGARPPGGFPSLSAVVEAALSSGLDISHLRTLILAGACDTLGERPRDRHALLSALPSLFEWATSQATRGGPGGANQLDLFSAPATPPPLEEDLREDNAQTSFDAVPTAYSPYERYLRNRWERDKLGVTFTEADEMHALIAVLEDSGALRSRLTSTESINAKQIGASIHIVGILCEIAFLEGQDGDTLAVCSLQDPYGTLELVTFPPNYKRHTSLWVENTLVAVTARVQAHQDGSLYLLCEHLALFTAGATDESFSITIKTRAARGAAANKEASQTPKPASSARPDLKIVAAPPPEPRREPQPAAPSGTPNFSLIISIPDADEDQPVIDSVISLKRLLEEYPGPDTVTIRVPYIRGRWTSASLSWGVGYSHQLESRIRRLLGDDAIAVIQLAS